MDKILERFSLGHLLSVIAPGLAALVFLAWRNGWDVTGILNRISSSPTVEGALVLILAYGLGLLLLECADTGAKVYLNLLLRRMTGISTHSVFRRKLAEPIRFLIAAMLFGIPLPRIRESFVEAQVMMSEYNESTSHIFTIARISSPFTTLELFRKLIPRKKLENSEAVLDQAAESHNRLLFALSVSLILTCIALTAVWDLAIHSGWGFAVRQTWDSALKSGWHSSFQVTYGSAFRWAKTAHQNKSLIVAVVAGVGSCFLRIIAARCWEVELILVSSLATWRGK
jgi:hypothetical protein